MQDTIKVTLSMEEYNAIFALAGEMTGQYAMVAASKLRDMISEDVRKHAKGEELPQTITLNVPKRVLDGFYTGLVDKSKNKEITTLVLLQIKAIACILKMKGRFEKYLEAEFEKTPSYAEDFDLEEITEPFDEDA